MGATPLQLPLAGAQKLQQQLLPSLHGRRSELQQPLLQLPMAYCSRRLGASPPWLATRCPPCLRAAAQCPWCLLGARQNAQQATHCSSSVPCLASSSSFATAHLPWKTAAPPRHALDSLRSLACCRSRTAVVSRSPSTSPSCTPPRSSANIAAATLPSIPHSPRSTKCLPSSSYTLVVAARCSSTHSPFAPCP